MGVFFDALLAIAVWRIFSTLTTENIVDQVEEKMEEKIRENVKDEYLEEDLDR
jgi:hypothetical protein